MPNVPSVADWPLVTSAELSSELLTGLLWKYQRNTDILASDVDNTGQMTVVAAD